MISEHEQNELATKRLRTRKNGGKTSTHGLAHLNTQQIRFIDEYMIDRNGGAAAIRAGYSEGKAKQAAYRLRNHPAVAAEIERRTHQSARRADVVADDILRELKRIAFFDVRRLFHDDGTFRNPMELNEDDARALVNFDVVTLGATGDYIVQLNPGNKLKALELLGKHAGMWVDRKEVDEKRTVKFSLDFGDGDKAGAAMVPN